MIKDSKLNNQTQDRSIKTFEFDGILVLSTEIGVT